MHVSDKENNQELRALARILAKWYGFSAYPVISTKPESCAS